MKPLFLLPLLLLATPALAQGAQAPSPEDQQAQQAQALIDNGRLEMALGQTAKQLIAAQKEITQLRAQLAKKDGEPKK